MIKFPGLCIISPNDKIISLFYSMNIPDFFSWRWFFLLTLVFWIIIIARYFLVAGIFYFVFYVWFPEKFKKRKISNKGYKKSQLQKEIRYSIINSFIFALAGVACVIAWQKGFTKVYLYAFEFGWWYLPVSLVIYMLLQETYYYWLHRWMHYPKIFKIVHKVHHDSNIASPFTAFSFHPYEGILQAIFLPILLLLIPVNIVVLIVLLTIMTFSSVINHLDIDIFPENPNNLLTKHIIGAAHHAKHHRYFKYNFGLYFTFWDRLINTEK